MTIVKIQHGNKSIHRRLCSVSAQGFTSGNIAISINSFYELYELLSSDSFQYGYSKVSGLVINKDIASKDSWMVKNIKARTKKLVEQLMKEYQLFKKQSD